MLHYLQSTGTSVYRLPSYSYAPVIVTGRNIMFGLSMKERLYKAIRTQTDATISDIDADLRAFARNANSMTSEELEKEYTRIIGMHSNAVSATLAQTLGSAAAFKAGMAIQSPQITGLPEEFDLDYLLDSGPKVGFYFAFYYYALTGRQIDLNDYGLYIRPLNKYQLDLLTTYLGRYSF